MLFNSYVFLLAFLPATLVGFHLIGRFGRDAALLWLIAASLVFYAWWRPLNVLLIAPSILINYAIARALLHLAAPRPRLGRALLLGGILFNIAFLGYFKYALFLTSVAHDVFGTNRLLTAVVLPLGISFITFQKIAFLVDVHGGRISRFSLRDYALFVLFFPQLVAGPIVHYREMMPQFHAAPCRCRAEDLAVGASLFCFGLFKKGILADQIATYVSPLYVAASGGAHPALLDAWLAALGFTLQIYFDFSGYTDMALGLARCFGIRLPMNFNSPLRATSIIEFWLRWHVSLTRFLTAYIYNPLSLALTRRRLARGKAVIGRRTTPAAFVTLLLFPTLLTMFLSGLWHGAGYQYVLWGVLHGVLLCINHGWRLLRARLWPKARRGTRLGAAAGFTLTFLAVVAGMALFRAPTVGTAVRIWGGMAGLNGIALPAAIYAHLGALPAALGIVPDWSGGTQLLEAWGWAAALLAIALGLPNTLQLLAAHEPALGVKPQATAGWLARRLQWTPSAAWAVGLAVLGAAGFLSLGRLSEFLYWQF